jgi:hypothetical protein
LFLGLNAEQLKMASQITAGTLKTHIQFRVNNYNFYLM